MTCPGCGAPMQHLVLDGKLSMQIGVDLCSSCRAIWFDQFKDLQLAPRGTLSLFGTISTASAGAPATALPAVMRCPRCGRRLMPTHDMQRATRFQYWRCDAEHGRFITFIDFLREKDFVRPLTAGQIDQLRQTVQTVNCGNCGAPIDLAKDSVCAHCGSPISILDPEQMARTVAQLQSGADPSHAASETNEEASHLNMAGARPPDLDGLMRFITTEAKSPSPQRELIDIGFRVLGHLVRTRQPDRVNQETG